MLTFLVVMKAHASSDSVAGTMCKFPALLCAVMILGLDLLTSLSETGP